MSTKINARSPFYLKLEQPTVPLPTFSCDIANLTGFSIDNEGLITEPIADFGTIYSITSDDGDFSNGKFPVESSDTSRTVKFTLNIPAFFSNSADLFFVCPKTVTQPGKTTSVVQPTVCSGGPSTSGSIPSQTLNDGGATTSIDLSSYFTGETVYAVNNASPSLITTALSGSTLTLTTNTIGGSATVYAIGRDASYPTTCEAVQSISITVNSATPTTWSCTVPTTALQGGSIAADGTLTNPQAAAVITAVKISAGGSAYSSDPNTTGSSRNVTLFFSLTVPVGYSNAGNTVECSKTFSQPATAAPNPTFSCSVAALTDQTITKKGAINLGSAAVGTVKSFTAPNPPLSSVTTNTARTIEYQVEIPSGYANSGTTINCSKSVIQPANISVCSSAVNAFYISGGKERTKNFCDATYSTSKLIYSSASSIPSLLGTQICKDGNAFVGKSLYYAVNTASISQAAGQGVGDYYAIQIDSSGICIDVQLGNCQGAGGNGSTISL